MIENMNLLMNHAFFVKNKCVHMVSEREPFKNLN